MPVKKHLKNKNRELIFIFFAIFLGSLIGVFFPNFMLSLKWIGDIFMNLLMMIILPLIFCALVSAIASMEDLKFVGKMGRYTILVILANVILGAFIGLLGALLVNPGANLNPAFFIGGQFDNLSASDSLTFTKFITAIFPANIISAAAKSDVLPIVFFGVFFSIIATKSLKSKDTQLVISFFTGFKNILMDMIAKIMILTPFALFSLIGTGVSQSVLQGHFLHDILGLLKFAVLFLACSFSLCLIQFFFVKLLGRKKKRHLLTPASPALVTAFATSSSLATLPSMLLVAKDLDIEESVAKFVLPLTVIFNLASTAMYITAATLFLSQALHIDLTLWQILLVFVTSVITGLGTTGIPNAGFIATLTVLKTVSIPAHAVAILFPLDVILSRIRTMVNVWGDLICTKIVQILVERRGK